MNIFVLHTLPMLAAHYHCDEHVRKMVVESAQMLSTAHRVSKFIFGEGERTSVINRKGNVVKQIILPEYGEHEGMRMQDSQAPYYWVANEGHPCNLWTRYTGGNYRWLYDLYIALGNEYVNRFHKINAASNLRQALRRIPECVESTPKRTSFPQAMPAKYHHTNVVEAYREFYRKDKIRFATWNYTEVPFWM